MGKGRSWERRGSEGTGDGVGEWVRRAAMIVNLNCILFYVMFLYLTTCLTKWNMQQQRQL